MWLAIDTSGAFASVAVGDEVSIASQREGDGTQSHSEQIDSLVRAALNESRCKIENINGILLGKGPGSFTGLRIGFSFTQGFALQRDIPVHLMPSALGANAPRVLAPAGKNLVFDTQVLLPLHRDSIRMQQIVSSVVTSEGLQIDPTRCVILSPIPELGELPVARELASGLLTAFFAIGPENFPPASRLATLEPDYVRPVAAKKIGDRAGNIA